MMKNIEVFPVIRVDTVQQAVEQAELAFGLDADGIVLHDRDDRDPRDFFRAYNQICAKYPNENNDSNTPGEFIGINPRRFPDPRIAYDTIAHMWGKGDIETLPSMIFVNSARGDSQAYGEHKLSRLEALGDLIAENPNIWDIKFYAGTAFKNTLDFTEDPLEAATQASLNMLFSDAIVTSGEHRGQAPHPDKIRAMKAAIGSQVLAVASGVTEANLEHYRSNTENYADQVIVHSGITGSVDSDVINERKLHQLIQAAHRA